ncbi:MFS transporter [Pelagicoccus enzymogenes]|uniref:MFS transporter n=1 Tax=Pelagicoccus enzymogenes TaxID=2773457 RepID=UPI00280C7564|nr:MFS transporter [Pelagicoccus enzymogenes]MDQ8200308.1 MFS transporter [Pelagicoccus enzymogenes]
MQQIAKAAKASLLASASMTVMAGAIIAPALPGIGAAFAHFPSAATLAPLVLTVTSLGVAICSLPAGLLCDRWGRKKVLLSSLILYALAGSYGYYANNLYLLLASRFALGMAVSGVMTSSNTLIADLFEGPRRLNFLGLQFAAMALSAVLFLVAGGFLAQASWRYPFALYSLSLLVFAAVFAFIKEPPNRAAPTQPDIGEKSDLQEIPAIRVTLLYATSFSGMLLFYLIASQLPFLLKSKFELSPPLVGAIIATSNFFGAVSGFNYNRVRQWVSAPRAFSLGFGLIALAFSVVAHAESLPFFFIAMALSGLGSGMIGPNANSSLADLIPSGQRGRFFGGLTTSIFIGQFLSPLSVQHAILYHGYQGFLGAFSIAAAFALLVSLLYLVRRA